MGNNTTDETTATRAGELLTVPEVADALRVSAATIRNWIAQGTVLAVNVGRQYRIPRRELDRMLTPRRPR